MASILEMPPLVRADGKPRSILFLDDEKSYVDLMAQLMMEHFSCPIFAFSNPFDALEALRKENIGVVVTDFYMPGLNGLEFIKRAHEISPATVLFLITGHTLELTEEELLRLPGLKGILYKPMSWRRLAEQIIPLWHGGELLR